MNAPSNALSGLPTARPEEVGLSRAALERLGEAMEREIAAGRAPGAAMLVARHGKVAFSHALGKLRPHGPPMPADAVFRIYSMTKPIVSVAAMTLVEEGRLVISDPLAKYIPAFAKTKVGVENGDGLDLVPLERPITIQDLMRHTSGLTYGFTGVSRVQKLVHAAAPMSQDRSAAEHVEALAALPLQHQPGKVWEYSHSTDVLGRVIEIVAGRSLGEVLSERIFAPLGMADTAFYLPDAKRERLAQPFSFDLLTASNIDTIESRQPPRCESGGGGLVSTIGDYARFLAMASGGGALNGARILGSRTLAFMASDHLGPHVVKNHFLLWPGHGFGLGFAVRLEPGIAPRAGAVGEYFWGGVAGTVFWVSPRDALFAILMVQAPEHREYFRNLFRNLVNAAIV
ncbi:MAG: serine hydrolase domain-containing protein [Roseiarcus sp.]|jgi:CubicO group peptidase (beta-lactamase class C family)